MFLSCFENYWFSYEDKACKQTPPLCRNTIFDLLCLFRVKNCSGYRDPQWIGSWSPDATQWANVSDATRYCICTEWRTVLGTETHNGLAPGPLMPRSGPMSLTPPGTVCGQSEELFWVQRPPMDWLLVPWCHTVGERLWSHQVLYSMCTLSQREWQRLLPLLLLFYQLFHTEP